MGDLFSTKTTRALVSAEIVQINGNIIAHF